MPRVVGIDPGTYSFDLFGLDGGEPFLAERVSTEEAGAVARVLERLAAARPLHGIAAPSGYGLPLRPGEEVGDEELRLAFLIPPQGTGFRTGGTVIRGLRELIRGLRELKVPFWFLPGVIHLSTVPGYRKANRIDMGTADKVAVVALGIHDQARRLGIPFEATSFLLLELGGAFTAALAVDEGRIIDGVGGSSGAPGYLASGSLDAEVVWLTSLTGPMSRGDLIQSGAAFWQSLEAPAHEEFLGRTENEAYELLIEGAIKNVLSLAANLPQPREVLLSGRLVEHIEVRRRLGGALSELAPVRRLEGWGGDVKTAAQGAALLADGLTGGRCQGLVEVLDLSSSRGTLFDYLRIPQARAIRRLFGL